MGVVSCFMTQSQVPHLEATNHILQYLRGTIDMGILFKKKRQIKVTCYTDVDSTWDAESLRSTEGYVFQLGGNPITWHKKRQQIVVFSSARSEYRAFTEGTKESLWLKGLLLELCVLEDEPIKLWCDNISNIKIARNFPN
jgi:hypothetical protein